MAVALNNSDARASSSGASTSISFSYTGSTGANRLLLAQTHAINTGTNATAVTYAGVALSTVATSAGNITWQLLAPATGANTFTFSTATYNAIESAAADFTGVDQTTPLGAVAASTGTGTAIATPSITVPASGLAWGSAYASYTVTTTPLTAANATILAGSVTSNYKKAGGYISATGPIEWTNNASSAWEAQGFPINAASSGTNTAVNPGAASVALSSSAPTVAQTANQTISPAAGTAALSSSAPAIGQPQAVNPASGTVALTGSAPVVTQAVTTNVSPGAGTLALTGSAPTAAQSVNQTVNPGAVSVALAGLAPTVAQTANQAVTPGAGTVALAGSAPTVAQQSASPNLMPGAVSLTITGYLPGVQTSGVGKSGVARNLQVYYQQLFEDARKKKEAAWLKTLEDRQKAKSDPEPQAAKPAKPLQKQVTAQKPELKYTKLVNNLPVKTTQQLIDEIVLEYPIPVLDPPRQRKVRSKRVVEDEAIFALLYAD